MIKNKIYAVCSCVPIYHLHGSVPTKTALHAIIRFVKQINQNGKLIRSVITIAYHVRFVQLHNHNHLLQKIRYVYLFALALKYIQSNVYYWSSGVLHDFKIVTATPWGGLESILVTLIQSSNFCTYFIYLSIYIASITALLEK